MSDKEELREELKLLKEQLARITDKLERVEEKPEVEEPEEPEEVEIPIEEASFDFDKEERKNRQDERYDRLYTKMNRRAWRHNEPWGDKLGEYINEFVNDVMENVNTELEQTLFIDTGRRRGKPSMMSDRDVQRTSAIMSAMGNEHRVSILKELSWGGMYSSDFQEVLKEISPSTLSSHLDVLEQVGLIHQEKKRGRYIITMAGRNAIRMAAQIAKRADVKLDFN